MKEYIEIDIEQKSWRVYFLERSGKIKIICKQPITGEGQIIFDWKPGIINELTEILNQLGPRIVEIDNSRKQVNLT